MERRVKMHMGALLGSYLPSRGQVDQPQPWSRDEAREQIVAGLYEYLLDKLGAHPEDARRAEAVMSMLDTIPPDDLAELAVKSVRELLRNRKGGDTVYRHLRRYAPGAMGRSYAVYLLYGQQVAIEELYYSYAETK